MVIRSPIHSTLRAVVVGSGIGGLAVAIRLAAAGHQVTVFEAAGTFGGKATDFWQDGYRFDAGPSLFTLPALVEELFSLAGRPPADFSYSACSTACRYQWNDGTVFKAPTDPRAFAAEAERVLGEDASVVTRYLKEAADSYQRLGAIFLQKPLNRLATWISPAVLHALPGLATSGLFGTMDSRNRSCFRSEKMVQLFNRFATYNGSDPFRAPALLTMIPHLEHGIGSFFPKGGIRAIPDALYGLACDLGVTFVFNKNVERIVLRGGRAAGVMVAGQVVEADLVVSNMDVVPTYRRLLPDVKAPEAILSQERSSSALIFYWGIKGVFPELDLHNIFFAGDYRAEFTRLFGARTAFEDPTVYVHISSKCESADAPEGCENWFVMVNAPQDLNVDWESYVVAARGAIQRKLAGVLGSDWSARIVNESVLTPPEIEQRTQSYRGALYGAASNNPFAAFLRHPNRRRLLPGLYFVGGSVHPGGGIPLVLLSAKIAAQEIQSDLAYEFPRA